MSQRSNLDLVALNKKNILQPASSISLLEKDGPRIITGGQGIYVQDSEGKTALDGIAGLWCVNVGYGREELAEAMAAACRELGYYHTFTNSSNVAQIELSERLIDMAPGKLSRVFFGTTGSDANDTLVKIVWHYNVLRGKPEKRKIISRFNAYHGTNVTGASLTGIPVFHKAFHLPIDGIMHLPENPHYYRYGKPGESEQDFANRQAQMLEDRILEEGPETVAAFIAEPILGAGGVIPPPEGYFDAVQKILKKYDILLIADEVICGYGRTGKNWGSEHYGIAPDLMTSAKGLTSGYFPLSAAYLTEEIYDVLRHGSETIGSFAHGYTYSGHPVGARVALANLAIVEREKLVENADSTGTYMLQQLAAKLGPHRHVGEVRGKGLLAAVQFVADKETGRFFDVGAKIPARLASACYDEGVIIRPLPSLSAFALSPPLVITREEVDLMISRLVTAVEKVMGSLSEQDLAGA